MFAVSFRATWRALRFVVMFIGHRPRLRTSDPSDRPSVRVWSASGPARGIAELVVPAHQRHGAHQDTCRIAPLVRNGKQGDTQRHDQRIPGRCSRFPWLRSSVARTINLDVAHIRPLAPFVLDLLATRGERIPNRDRVQVVASKDAFRGPHLALLDFVGVLVESETRSSSVLCHLSRSVSVREVVGNSEYLR